MAEIFRVQAKWKFALDGYLNVLKSNPKQSESRERVAFLYGVSGQRWDSIPHLMSLIELQRWDLQTLSVLTDIERPIEQQDLVNSSYGLQPNDPIVALAKAHDYLINGNAPDARPILEAMLRTPSCPSGAYEMLGEVLFQMSDTAALANWNRNLPSQLENSATVWFIRGQHARSRESSILQHVVMLKRSQLSLSTDKLFTNLDRCYLNWESSKRKRSLNVPNSRPR